MPEYIRMGDEDTASNRNDTCFICLEDSSQGRLKRCCSQCYALVHGRCWSKWSSSQQIAALRSIMLGEQARETEVCSICRGGSVQIEHSEDDSEEISKQDLWEPVWLFCGLHRGAPILKLGNRLDQWHLYIAHFHIYTIPGWVSGQQEPDYHFPVGLHYTGAAIPDTDRNAQETGSARAGNSRAQSRRFIRR
ncbi:ring finger domain-containing protein [Cryptosporidium canis]|uniref:Ring finger domain-containing protein n=1 Tax=Cryptosporidium canis TaxID=195482 RepID=A0ABQ8PA35_9CRYT|nr:ring finger domain-containing protein [Cryptosporidium canis]KAJ1614184.1 ring finger domain-containing protein [Cryptosporidium canis]